MAPEDPGPVSGKSEYTFPPPSSSPLPSSSASVSSSLSYGVQYSQGFFSSPPTPSVRPFIYAPPADISSSRGRGFRMPPQVSGTRPPRSPLYYQGSGSNTGDILAAYLDAEPSNSRRCRLQQRWLWNRWSFLECIQPRLASASSASSTSGIAQRQVLPQQPAPIPAQGGDSGPHWILIGTNTPGQSQGHAQSHPATPTSAGPRTNAIARSLICAKI